ncbi:hypothetical protein [Ulvibacter antarcticus]|uniref:Alpha/beta hydrolase family protein n=1 Tax=Ulvibacter antarcticus TaxID=442714 RepID=A0A3L9YEW6_9FLAO|nr:hypothetical protein [Ulvibacter antarcticus]RMA58017.1 hypothetical protein BXY75_2825 [Ulvibacter antarcticus]
MKSFLTIIISISLFLSASIATSQPINQTLNTNFSYPETILPSDTTKLWLAEGDPTNQIVTIFLQGGPKDDLDFETRKKSSWRYLPEYDKYYAIHLHQSNTLNPAMFAYDCDFTMAMARKEVDNSSEILYRAIKHFKDLDKTVYVMGHSYGAFIIPHYLATRPSIADKYFIISGRIDDPKVVVKAHKKGFNGIYKNGVTFISDEGAKDYSDYNGWALKYYIAKQRIKAAIGEISYSKALKNVDLSDVTYIYNPNDDRVGGLTESELEFLNSKSVSTFSVDWEHGYTIRGLVDLVKAGKIDL